MRRIRVAEIALLATLGAWANPAGAEPFSTTGAVPASLPVTVPITPIPERAPDVLLKTVTLEVIAFVRQDKDIAAGNPAKITGLVENRIAPLVDFTRMTQIAVARNWRLATREQQNALTSEYKTLLVRTFSAALSSYRDQVIEYKPLRAEPGAIEVTVKSTLKQLGADRTTVDYDMEKTPAGWKVYDIKIAGISLISTYQSTFGRAIRDSGLDGLIQSLSARNRQAESELGAQEDGARRPFLFFLYAVIPSVFRGGR